MSLIKRLLLLTGALFFLILANGIGPYYDASLKTSSALAYEASSSSFFIRGATLDDIAGRASSSTFIHYIAGGQAISGLASSTSSFINHMGILDAIFRSFIPNYQQIHFHWRNDDGTEATATSATSGVQDTTLASIAKNTVKRIRIEISNSGGVSNISTQQLRIEYGLKSTTCAAIGSWIDVGAVGGDWDMGASQLVEASDTTDVAVSIGGVTGANNTFLTPNGGQRETTSQTGNLTVANNNFVELEYAIQALAAATNGATYCFRLTNAGSTTNYTYTQYPQATLAAGAASITLTLNAGGIVTFGSIIAGGQRKTSTTNLLVTQSNATSINITAGRQRAISNVTLASNAAPTVTMNQVSDTVNGIDVFNTIATCSTVGSHPAIWPGSTGVSTGLGFTLWKDSNSSKDTNCWGTGTTESGSLNQYAALPASASASSFVSIPSSPPASFYASIGYSLEVRSIQKATPYNGAVVFTATALP